MSETSDLKPSRPHQTLHPCQTCGACCASYRVSFHWREAEPDPDDKSDHSVPQEYTEDLNLDRRCMKGTNAKHKPSCIALMGEVGKSAHCIIYHNRPSPCRIFKASYEDGYHQVRCDEARAKHGLNPLTKQDYLRIESPAPALENPARDAEV